MDNFVDEDETRLAALGITPDDIGAFCATLGSVPEDADEEFWRLKAHFRLSEEDFRFVLRYLEGWSPL